MKNLKSASQGAQDKNKSVSRNNGCNCETCTCETCTCSNSKSATCACGNPCNCGGSCNC